MKKPTQMHICWHGTDEKAARSILKTGFRKDTHFAAHAEDALAMGGPFLFAVEFGNAAPNWQFLNTRRIPPSRIRCLTEFWSKTRFGENLFWKTEVED